MGDLSEHFSRSEFSCKDGCGFDTVDAELITVLEDVRTSFRMPVIINSGCRCEEHNKLANGSEKSQHLKGRAADFRVEGLHPDMVANYLERKYFDRYGIGRYDGRTHIDTRSDGPTRWDKR